jgi:hypothetical protein
VRGRKAGAVRELADGQHVGAFVFHGRDPGPSSRWRLKRPGEGGNRSAGHQPAHGGTYLECATERPALYQAMLVLPTGVKSRAPRHRPRYRPLSASSNSCFRPDNERRELFAEVTWSALHSMAVLSDSGRIPPDRREERLDFLVIQVAGSPAG